ncbi:MAG: calcineurin-like phosphoesterase family protein [Bacteroidales bacterium]|nr:calcineurin-like phosphoesterase family protein [Bacteroidales bacterium]
MRIVFYLLLLQLIFVGVSAQSLETATGIVFEDLNKNNVFDQGELLIPNVAVSNGTDVVLTDENGRYRISVGDDAIVFVIKPGNYNYPLTENNLPRFFYNHKPKGSPELKFEGVSPTGPLPASIDFPLLSNGVTDAFSILVFSDPQPYIEEHIQYYERDIVEELLGESEHAFGITLGDLTGDNPDFFEPINKATSRIGLPWFNVIGNHDLNFDATEFKYNDESFESVYGPSHYAFSHGKVHFFVLHNIMFPNTFTDYFYVGGITEQQFNFIENSLQHIPKDNLIVFFMHIPLYNIPEWGTTFLKEHRHRLFDLIKDRPFTFSLSGHMHTQLHHYFGANDGWKQSAEHHHYTVGTASGDWWSGGFKENGVPVSTMSDGSPNGYNILHFKGNTYSWDYKAAGKDANHRMRIYGPKKFQTGKTNRAELYVNFFQGSEKDSVYFQVGGGKWNPMNYILEQDPYVASVRALWDQAEILPEGVRPSGPSVSKHLWKARIPRNLKAGKNTITVKVKHGERAFFDTFDFEVVDEKLH